jgi:hypothetical protein
MKMIHILKSDLLDHEVDVLQHHFWCHFEETMTLQEPWHGRTAALFKIDQRNRQERSGNHTALRQFQVQLLPSSKSEIFFIDHQRLPALPGLKPMVWIPKML